MPKVEVTSVTEPVVPWAHGLRAWASWLEGNEPVRVLLPPLPALRSFQTSFDRILRTQPQLSEHIFDWVFPADRYEAEPTARRLGKLSLPLDYKGVRRVLDTPKVNEHLLRAFYAGALATFDAQVDHRGHIHGTHGTKHLGLQLLQANPVQVRQLARLLRFLHLAGWRGFDYDGKRDPWDHSYARGLLQGLERAWLSAGGRDEELPQVWRQALQAPGVSTPDQVLSRCLRRIRVLGDTLYRR